MQARWPQIEYLVAEPVEATEIKYIFIPLQHEKQTECCCSDVAEAVEAMKGGAGRVELCKDLSCGGVTPGRSDIEATLSAVNIPVNVLIRVRGGDFVYDEDEINTMIESVRMCRELGVNGVVVGALRKDGSIDTEAVRRLMAEAGGLHVTFHRAFDECADPRILSLSGATGC